MYTPVRFRESRPDVLAAAIRAHPLACLVSRTPAEYHVSHVPMILKTDEEGRTVIDCHVARANPHWTAATTPAASVAIFRGPQAYVSPGWYPSKREHGRVVPTWNYIVIQATGMLRSIDAHEWVLDHIRELTDEHEGGRVDPWAVTDAPTTFIEHLSSTIVGMQLTVDRLEGSWKMQQHRSDADRNGVITGLDASGDPRTREVGAVMRELERAR